jgi:hypothetical protein
MPPGIDIYGPMPIPLIFIPVRNIPGLGGCIMGLGIPPMLPIPMFMFMFIPPIIPGIFVEKALVAN